MSVQPRAKKGKKSLDFFPEFCGYECIFMSVQHQAQKGKKHSTFFLDFCGMTVYL